MTAWEARRHPVVAVDRLLDAAGRCFERQGVRATTLTDVANQAGCSRPTVYRYFADRDALRRAFVRREAARLGAEVLAALDTGGPAAGWLGDAIAAVLHRVRADPTLAAWFLPDDAGTTVVLALGPELLGDLSSALLPAPADRDGRERAEWVVRAILSLLSSPGPDDATERRWIDTYVVPVVTGPLNAPRL